MAFDDLKKKYAGLIKSQEEEANKPSPDIDWGSFEMSLPDITNSVLSPAFEDARLFVDELKLSPVVRVNDQIRGLGDSPLNHWHSTGDIKKSLISISFGLPTGRTKRGTAIHFGGRVHVIIASKWMHLSLFVYASNPRTSGNDRYEKIAEVPAKDISSEAIAAELSKAIDWILTSHAEPY